VDGISRMEGVSKIDDMPGYSFLIVFSLLLEKKTRETYEKLPRL
jgi:hypothetical protein